MVKKTCIIAVLFCLIICAFTSAQEKNEFNNSKKLNRWLKKLRKGRSTLVFSLHKKLIANGWYRPSPKRLVSETSPKKIPFDGIVMMLEGGRQPFKPVRWKTKDFEHDFQSLSSLQSKSLTDNFIWMDCASNIDWFDEQQWQKVLHNTRIIARCVLIGRCAGILFDPECYGPNLWSYPQQNKQHKKTFSEFETIVKNRGEEWIKVVQQECPKIRILTLFWSGCDYLVLDTYNATGRDTPLNAQTFSQKIINLKHRLQKVPYGLLPAFMNGMLKGIHLDSMIINGNEAAYYYEKRKDYQKYCNYAKNYLPIAFIDPQLREKYQKVVKLGFTWYTDYYFTNLGNADSGFGLNMKLSEQQKWVEHNVYWALHYSDEYVWEWSEGSWEKPFDWWKGHLPPGYSAMVKSVKTKIIEGKPLGYKSKTIFSSLFKRLRKKIPFVNITRLKSRDKPPLIDGNIEETVWQTCDKLRVFMPRVDQKTTISVPTTILLCADLTAIYIAFKCKEPYMDEVKCVSNKDDDDKILDDDSVQVVIAKHNSEFPLYYFGLNTAGFRLDYLCNEARWEAWEQKYAPKWQSCVSRKQDSWYAELKIPWQSLQVKPHFPIKLKSNFLRNRAHCDEKAAWAPSVRWSLTPLESEWFGTIAIE